MIARATASCIARYAVGLAMAIGLTACGVSANSATNDGQQAQPAPSAPTGQHGPLSIASLADPGPAEKYLGIEANGAPDSLTPVETVAANLGHKPDLVGQYVEWGSPFDRQAVINTWSYGALYYMAWEPYNVTVESIADGQSDGYLTQFAKAVRALDLPVAISFGHEMNGNWYPWGSAQTTPATFVAAWRHIHLLFSQAGATNVIWVWNPNIINPMPTVRLKPYWPGAAYVTWVGLTGYFATTGPDTFAGIFGPTMKEIRKFTSRPFIIAETAVETGPDDITSTRNLVAGVASRTDVLGLIWFDYNKGGVDWGIESRPAVRAALAAGISELTLVSPAR